MSFSKMVSQPGMFFEKLKGRIAFKQLKSFTNTHSWRKLNKEVYVVNSDMQLINFAFSPISNLSNKELTIHSKPIELKRVFGIFNFPDKMESILSKAMFSGFQIHFLSPKSATRKRAHANFTFSSEGLVSSPSHINYSKELNVGDGDSSPSLKARVSSPWM